MSSEVYVPAVGDVVRMQLWSPVDAPKAIPYGPPRIMIVKGITEDYNGTGLTRYWTADVKHPNDEWAQSWSESDWTDLEPVADELGMLF